MSDPVSGEYQHEVCPCGYPLAPCPTCGDEWCARCEGNECDADIGSSRQAL